MIILDIEKPKRCGKCPMHNDGNDYCKLAHDHASFVRAKGCPIQEPKTGHWRPIYQGDEIIDYRCSECEFGSTFGKSTHGMNFCPNCGADMRTKAESEEK